VPAIYNKMFSGQLIIWLVASGYSTCVLQTYTVFHNYWTP